MSAAKLDQAGQPVMQIYHLITIEIDKSELKIEQKHISHDCKAIKQMTENRQVLVSKWNLLLETSRKEFCLMVFSAEAAKMLCSSSTDREHVNYDTK